MLDSTLVGKTIRLRVDVRKVPGEVIHPYSETSSFIVGVVQSVGYNDIIGCFQICLGNTPYRDVEENDITIID